jgi:hypothetical protein
MFKSKLFLSLLFIVFLSSTSVAQTYVKGYYIALSGDTVRGTFLTNSYTQMSKSIRFKAKDGQVSVITPNMAQLVWLMPDRYFKNLSEEINGVYFLRRLSKKDSLTLLKFEYDQYQGLFIHKMGGKMAQLYAFTDYFSTKKDDFLKKELVSTDTLAYMDQLIIFGNLGDYKVRRAYLFTLRQFFGNCDDNIVNKSYKLNDDDVRAAFHDLAKCVGTKTKATDYFKTSSWRLSLGITAGQQIGSQNFDYTSRIGGGLFLNYGDLRDGIGVGINWLKAEPKSTAFSRKSGSFTEYSVFYNRKLFLRAKFNVAMLAGASYLKNKGLSVQTPIPGTPYYVDALPKEHHTYALFGISVAYQFAQNNYLNCLIQRNFYNVFKDATYLNRLQLQYEHRF